MTGLDDLGVQLSPAGRRILRHHEDRWTGGARFDITLEWLVRSWSEFARRVEAGYVGYFEEYLNDLTSRDLLDELVRALQADDAPFVEAKISGADGTYRQATRADEAHDLGKMFRIELGAGWWWRRVPLKWPADPDDSAYARYQPTIPQILATQVRTRASAVRNLVSLLLDVAPAWLWKPGNCGTSVHTRCTSASPETAAAPLSGSTER